MPLDTEFLRRHYAAMSDEELFSLDRDDLVEAARDILDEEVQKREAAEAEPDFEVAEHPDESAEADWLDDAAEAFFSYFLPGAPPSEVMEAREVLDAARIPTHLETVEEPEQEEQYQHRMRVLVPGKLIHRAMSVLDRDIFNQRFEFEWRNHLELISDNDLRIMEPHYAFCGLYDKLERINRAYAEELERRRLNK